MTLLSSYIFDFNVNYVTEKEYLEALAAILFNLSTEESVSARLARMVVENLINLVRCEKIVDCGMVYTHVSRILKNLSHSPANRTLFFKLELSKKLDSSLGLIPPQTTSSYEIATAKLGKEKQSKFTKLKNGFMTWTYDAFERNLEDQTQFYGRRKVKPFSLSLMEEKRILLSARSSNLPLIGPVFSDDYYYDRPSRPVSMRELKRPLHTTW